MKRDGVFRSLVLAAWCLDIGGACYLSCAERCGWLLEVAAWLSSVGPMLGLIAYDAKRVSAEEAWPHSN